MKLYCTWWPDLDEAWRILKSHFGDGLIWDKPLIRYRYETVVASGRRRNIVLEPVLLVEVDTAEALVGIVMGNLSARRGMIMGMADMEGDRKLISAEVPLSELGDFAKALAEWTGDTARANARFHGYQERPARLDPDPDEPMSAALRA